MDQRLPGPSQAAMPGLVRDPSAASTATAPAAQSGWSGAPPANSPGVEIFSAPDDTGELRASDLHTSLGESLGAQFREAFMGGTRSLMRASQYLGAEHGVDPLFAMGMPEGGFAAADFYQKAMGELAAAPDVSIADAREEVRKAGLEHEIKLPDQQTIRRPVLDMMLEDARERADYAAAVDRGPRGFIPGALGYATQIGAGLIDPVNVAAFSMPVLGEARYGKILASVGDSILGRGAVRAGVGAAQGAVGGAVLEPADWWLHTQDGQDYTMADALKSVVLSAGMGALFHSGLGAGGDLLARARGKPLPGSAEDLRLQAVAGDEHAADLVEQLAGRPGAAEGGEAGPGVDVEAVPGVTGPLEARTAAEAPPAPEQGGGENNAQLEGSAGQFAGEQPPVEGAEAYGGFEHPSEVLADLPQHAQEDVVRASIARVIGGDKVNAAELLHEAAKADPRIAESVAPPPGREFKFVNEDKFNDWRAQRDAAAAADRGASAPAAIAPTIGRTWRQPKAGKADTQSLNEFLAEHGGLDPNDPLIGDVRASIGTSNKVVGSYGRLIRKGGMKLDRAREAAVEAGYLHDEGHLSGGEDQTTIPDLLELIDHELRGNKVYRYGRGPTGGEPMRGSSKQIATTPTLSSPKGSRASARTFQQFHTSGASVLSI